MHRQRGSPKEKGEWVGEEFKEGGEETGTDEKVTMKKGEAGVGRDAKQ